MFDRSLPYPMLNNVGISVSDLILWVIKDRIMNGDLEVNYCSTDDIVADYMTKPLQGAKFYRFRKIIMNL